MNHPVIIDLGIRGDPAQASSVANVLARAGQATLTGRSIKRTLQLRYAAHAIWNRGTCGCRAGADSAKAESARKTLLSALVGATGVRTTAWGEGIGRVNWGPSAAGGLDPQPDGIRHKPSGGAQRRRCGHSKRRSGRTIQPAVRSQGPLDPRSRSEVFGADWTQVPLRIKRRGRRYRQ